MNTLDNIMGVQEASKQWFFSPGYIKNLCARGEVRARNIGGTWIIDKDQPKPEKMRR